MAELEEIETLEEKQEQENRRDALEKNRLDSKRNPLRALSISLDTIRKLSGPSLISEKLLAFNIIIFILTMSLIISHLWIGGDELVSLTGLFVAFISLFASSFVSIPYAVFMEIMSSLQTDKISSLRIGSTILLVGFSLASAGLFFNEMTATISAIIIIGIQVIPFLLGVFIGLSRGKVADREVRTRAVKQVLGWFTGIITLVSLHLNMTFLIMSVVLND